jgi:serine/threonine protein kinase
MLARYDLEHELGTGARGAVYCGRDKTTGRTVAIKLVADDSPPDTCGVEAALAPDLRARTLDHPDIAQVHGSARAGLLRYVAMELAAGADLSAHARAGNLLALHVVLSIAVRAASALDHAHSRGVVHGDVKPSNIVYDPATGGVKLIDFPLNEVAARRTSLAYLAPEVLCGGARTAASDQFALGVTVFQLTCGHLPFIARSQAELAYRIVHEAPADLRSHAPEAPAALSAILERALANAPASRYPTLVRFVRDVSRLRASHPLAPAAASSAA